MKAYTLTGRLILAALAAAAAFIFIFALPNFLNRTAVYLIAAFLIIAAVVWVCGKLEISERLFITLLICASLALRVCFVLAVDTVPIQDFALMYDAADKAASGDLSAIHNDHYFYFWAYQTGWVLWLAFWIKFFHAGLLFFKLMNCAALTAVNLLLYLLAKELASAKAARAVAVLYLIYPGSYVLLGVIAISIETGLQASPKTR